MKILVVTDQFKKGGLETHIAAYAGALGTAHTVWLACADYTPTGLLDDAQVLTGFRFSFYDTVAQLREDVERLCTVIREKHIDVLHVHPWYGLYAACFAAAKTGVKLIVTVHGFVSLSYLGNVYDELWMESILTDAVGHAFSVSRLGLDMLASMHMPRASLLPNAVDLTRFTPAVPAANRRWAMVTRLDADKLGAVETLIAMLPELELDALDIYGDGACAERVRALADACPKPVRLMGHSTTLHEQLRRDYFGVIGLGRCAVEGLALGLPVLLAGYGKVCGLVDGGVYARAAEMNFVTETLPPLDAQALNAQLRAAYADPGAYCFADRVRKDFDAAVCAQRMVQTIADAPSGMPLYVAELYDALCALPDETPVHESVPVFRLLRDTLTVRTQNLYLKDQLLLQRLGEQALSGAAFDLRTELGGLDERLHTTRLELGALDERLYTTRVEMHAADQSILSAQSRETAALQKQLAGAQAELRALTERLDTMTLGSLLRQAVHWKLVKPLKRLLRKT